MKDFSTHAEWVEILEESKDHAVLVFKHSDTCPISAAAHHRILRAIHDNRLTLPVYRIIVQDSPNLSSEIAAKLHVQHESPQALIIKNGEALLHASHGDINPDDLNNY
jgi:bacillithiol system protein YtxJ